MRRAILLCALLFATARTAAAEPTEADKDAARILFTEATDLRNAGKTAAALDRFKRAYELAPTPITALELARTHALLGHLVEARRLYRAIDGVEKKPSESAKSLAARDEAKTLAQELDARVPSIVVRVSGGTATFASIDGASVDVAALAAPIALDPGKHVILARGTTEASAEITLAEGERDREVTLVLPAPKPPPPTNPPPNKTAEPAPATWPTTMRWIGLATGGVGLLVGAGAGALALSSASAVKDGCAGSVCPPSRHDDLDATRRWATVSTIGFGVAAIGATLFVIGVASTPDKRAGKDVAATITPYASLGGIGLTGSF